MLTTVLTYENLFFDEPASFDKLIKDISTKLIIQIGSVINSELYKDSSGPETQIKLLNFLIRRQKQSIIDEIIEKSSRIAVNTHETSINFFSPHLVLEFLHKCLLLYNDEPGVTDLTQEQDLKLFKAYLLSNQQTLNRAKHSFNSNSPDQYFRENIWPQMVGQFLMNYPKEYFSSMVKAKCVLDALQFESEYSDYVERFIGRYDDPNTFTYIFRFVNSLKVSEQNNDRLYFKPFFIKAETKDQAFFEALCLNPETYRDRFLDGHKAFTGFKEKPLVQYENGVYIVLHWGLLALKIYDSMIFDFHLNSGIIEIKKLKRFADFKKYLGEEAIEKYLFKNLIKAIFNNKYDKLVFDDAGKKRQPDAYVRRGKKVFLFEIKDSLFSSEAIQSNNYDQIKAEIDKKYNTSSPKKKGTFQLIEQIKEMVKQPFEDDTYQQLGLKPRNLVIYPIIVFTDQHFSLPGVSNYLEERFNDLVQKSNINLEFKSINPLSFIPLDFLILNLQLLQSKKTSLEKAIIAVNDELRKRNKRYYKTRTLEDLHYVNSNFNRLLISRMDEFGHKVDNPKAIYEALDLGRGL